jgi:hypothetical protein
MMGCNKCKGTGGLLLLLAGILFLLVDLGIWSFWGIQWWTVLFILWGLGSFCMTKCSDCCGVEAPAKAPARKR